MKFLMVAEQYTGNRWKKNIKEKKITPYPISSDKLTVIGPLKSLLNVPQPFRLSTGLC